jgi:hypothetical protein
LDNQGNLLWVHQIATNQGGESMGIESDVNGNIYNCGLFSWGADFNPGPGSYSVQGFSPSSPYTCKVDAQGNLMSVWYAQALQFSGQGVSYSVAKDNFGTIYTAGYFTQAGLNFDPGISNYSLTPVGSYNAFIVRLTSVPPQGFFDKPLDPNSIKIWPSPCTSKLNLEISNISEKFVDIVFYNQLGEAVLTQNNFRANGNQIAVEHLPDGLYTIVVTANSFIWRQRFIVLKV